MTSPLPVVSVDANDPRLKSLLPVVAFDLDDTLLDFIYPAYASLNAKCSLALRPEDQPDYQMASRFGISNQEMFQHFLDTGFYEKLRPYPGVPEALKSLAQVASIHIVTRRGVIGGDIKAITLQWLAANSIPWHRCAVLTHEDGPKAASLASGTLALFEDHPLELAQAAKVAKVPNLYLVSQPWNLESEVRYKLPVGIVRPLKLAQMIGELADLIAKR